MLSSSSFLSSEFTNIPVAVSLLHEQEYKNLCKLVQKEQQGKRRSCSEKNTHKMVEHKRMSVSCKG
jgi:hypothetical protein